MLHISQAQLNHNSLNKGEREPHQSLQTRGLERITKIPNLVMRTYYKLLQGHACRHRDGTKILQYKSPNVKIAHPGPMCQQAKSKLRTKLPRDRRFNVSRKVGSWSNDVNLYEAIPGIPKL